MPKQKPNTAKFCAVCGRKLPQEGKRVYSKWTKQYYCIPNPSCKKKGGKR